MDAPSKIVIIGSGPAAWTAAIYLARAKLSPTVIAGDQAGGQLMLTTEVENYPGFPGSILGPDLMAAMRKQAEKLGVKIIDKDATALSKTGTTDELWVVSYGSSHNSQLTISAQAVILATGARANTLKIPGEDRLMGRGVSTCAVCDAPFFRGKQLVFVVGGGDSAMEEASELSKFVSKVIILVRSEKLRASAILTERVQNKSNIEIYYQSTVKELIGDQKLEKVRIIRRNIEEVVNADGLFYAISHTPATGWLKDSGVNLDEKGYILTPLSRVISSSGGGGDAGIDKSQVSSVAGDRLQTIGETSFATATGDLFPTVTSLPGVFAAGDCVDPRYRQAVTAAGFGCMAALDAQAWLERRTSP